MSWAARPAVLTRSLWTRTLMPLTFPLAREWKRAPRRSGDRPAGRTAVRLHRLLVGRDDVGSGVDRREAQELLAGVRHLVGNAGRHHRDPAGDDPLALLGDRDERRAGDHHDRLLGAVGVARQAPARIDLEQRAAGRGRPRPGPVGGRRTPPRRCLPLDPRLLELSGVERFHHGPPLPCSAPELRPTSWGYPRRTVISGQEHLSAREERLGWILGSSRSGSTWLASMLAAIDGATSIDDPHLGHHLGHGRQRAGADDAARAEARVRPLLLLRPLSRGVASSAARPDHREVRSAARRTG